MRLLIVEDERVLAGALSTGLGAEGWTVDVAHDGREGWLLASTGAYAAIVLDLMLPTMSGFAICEQLRRDGVTTPVIVLTAKGGEDDELDALDHGADDYLRKPFTYAVLVARLRALVRRTSDAAPDLVEVDGLTVDLRGRSCRRGALGIELGAREFAVLETLVRAGGRAVSKHELLLAAWPGESDDVNLVEARVSSLRRKIDLPFGTNTVGTVRGAGYRVEFR